MTINAQGEGAETTHQVFSADGATIGYRQLGLGPGILILHGGARASQHYLGIARLLADTYTLIIPDRRGRGLSSPLNTDYSIVKACEDMQAVIQATGARLLFGHSAGGAIALEVARTVDIAALMLYEPAAPVGHMLPIEWVPPFEEALAHNDAASAMAIFMRGLQLDWMGKLPAWVLKPIFSLMLQNDGKDEYVELLKTLGPELRMIDQIDADEARYRSIVAPTLLMAGGKSPAYLREIVSLLGKILPSATQAEFPGLDHTSPEEEGAPVIASAMRDFLAATARTK